MPELRLNLNPVTRVFSPAVALLLASLLLCSLAVAQESKPAPNKSFAQINQRVEELLKKMRSRKRLGSSTKCPRRIF